MKIAVIDIGSNSVRLMIWANGMSFYKKVTTTRLGEGLVHSGVLSDVAISRTVKAVCEFYREARAQTAQVYAFATAAVRSAKNGAEFSACVKEECSLTVDVVSGKDEALLGILGALGSRDGGIIDVGGASCEVSFRQNGKTTFSHSIDWGAVRLLDKCRDQKERLDEVLSLDELTGIIPVEKTYAIGGTASTLACVKLALKEYDAKKVQDCPLAFEEVKRLALLLLSLSVEDRKRIVGMDEKRADIIAGGAYMLYKVMEKLHLSTVYASDRDNLEGYLTLRGLVK